MQQYDICKCGNRVMHGFPCPNCSPQLLPGACDVTPGSSAANTVQQGNADEREAEKLGVTVERFLKMRAYARVLRRKHPQMKPDRLARKVAEHFKSKLV